MQSNTIETSGPIALIGKTSFEIQYQNTMLRGIIKRELMHYEWALSFRANLLAHERERVTPWFELRQKLYQIAANTCIHRLQNGSLSLIFFITFTSIMGNHYEWYQTQAVVTVSVASKFTKLLESVLEHIFKWLTKSVFQIKFFRIVYQKKGPFTTNH